ncbi:MAG: amino acid permease [Acidobacteriota bacterium]|nr:MAG: amino acid permease [Acidobacteriota bacterium]
MSEEKLVRGIGRWDLAAIFINTVIGAGIFGLPAKVHGLIGTWSLVAFAACAVVVGFIVLCYAEVASRFTGTGGPYLYAREAFGPVVGFEVGWLYWIVRVTSFAANCNLLITYFGFFVPDAGEGSFRIMVISLIILTIFAVNLVGVKQTTILTNIFTAGKLIPLIIFVAVGIFFIQPGNFTIDAVPEYGAFSSAVLLLIYAFVGFEVGVIMGGETKDPQRNIPIALFVALSVIAVLYILIQVVSIGTLPGLAASERPLADAGAVFLGTYGAAFITVGALVSILGNLNVGFLGSTRLLFAMSDNGELPAKLSETHDKFKTPWLSITLTALVIFVLTVYSTFLTALAIATITRLLVYATTCLALPVFRRRGDAPEAKFSAPLGVVAAVLSLILIGWLLTRVDLVKEGLPILIAAGVGLVILGLNRALSKRNEVST